MILQIDEPDRSGVPEVIAPRDLVSGENILKVSQKLRDSLARFSLLDHEAPFALKNVSVP